MIDNKYKLAKLVTSKEIFQKLILEKIEPPTSLEKWIHIFPFMANIDWSKIFSLSFRTIWEPYFHSFQYKVLNQILNCKDKLLTWKQTDNNTCVYCNDIDSLENHLFYCVECVSFWLESLNGSKVTLTLALT